MSTLGIALHPSLAIEVVDEAIEAVEDEGNVSFEPGQIRYTTDSRDFNRDDIPKTTVNTINVLSLADAVVAIDILMQIKDVLGGSIHKVSIR